MEMNSPIIRIDCTHNDTFMVIKLNHWTQLLNSFDIVVEFMWRD